MKIAVFVAAAVTVVSGEDGSAGSDFLRGIECKPKHCKEWDCAMWCMCFEDELEVDGVYAGTCKDDGTNTCECVENKFHVHEYNKYWNFENDAKIIPDPAKAHFNNINVNGATSYAESKKEFWAPLEVTVQMKQNVTADEQNVFESPQTEVSLLPLKASTCGVNSRPLSMRECKKHFTQNLQILDSSDEHADKVHGCGSSDGGKTQFWNPNAETSNKAGQKYCTTTVAATKCGALQVFPQPGVPGVSGYSLTINDKDEYGVYPYATAGRNAEKWTSSTPLSANQTTFDHEESNGRVQPWTQLTVTIALDGTVTYKVDKEVVKTYQETDSPMTHGVLRVGGGEGCGNWRFKDLEIKKGGRDASVHLTPWKRDQSNLEYEDKWGNFYLKQWGNQEEWARDSRATNTTKDEEQREFGLRYPDNAECPVWKATRKSEPCNPTLTRIFKNHDMIYAVKHPSFGGEKLKHDLPICKNSCKNHRNCAVDGCHRSIEKCNSEGCVVANEEHRNKPKPTVGCVDLCCPREGKVNSIDVEAATAAENSFMQMLYERGLKDENYNFAADMGNMENDKHYQWHLANETKTRKLQAYLEYGRKAYADAKINKCNLGLRTNPRFEERAKKKWYEGHKNWKHGDK